MIYTDEQAIQLLQERCNITFSEEQLSILRHRGGIQIVACAGSGKALVNGTGVLTPHGYKPIESLKVGDKVYSDTGLVSVLGVYPQGLKEEYKLEFNNGVDSGCCEDHLWTYYNEYGEKMTSSIKEIINNKSKMANESEYIPSNIRIKLPKPVEFGEYKSGGYNLGASCQHDLCQIEQFKYSSIESRKELLAGLIDMYGFSDGPEYIIRLSNEEALESYRSIAESLGLFVYTKYTNELHIKTTSTMGKLHNSRDINWDGTYCDYIELEKIVKTNKSKEMTCIEVSGESKLYLTEHCIPTHNTTIITYLVVKRIMTGELYNPRQLLMTTYSKSGAVEMENRIKALLDLVGVNERVEVKTIHASYYKCLARFNLLKPIMSSAKRRGLIKKAINQITLHMEEQDMDEIDRLISFQVNNMYSDENLYKSYEFNVDISLEDYSSIRANYAKFKQEEGLMDFDDLQYYVYYYLCYLKHPEFVQYCKSQWKYFYVDEFQDTSKIQFSILRELLSNSDNLMVIGDDDQCIYSWRGADPSIILNIGAYYNLKKCYLSTNYRCREEILGLAEHGVSHMYNREEKQMQAFKKEGLIELCNKPCKDLYGMNVSVRNYIKDRLLDGEKASEIAVLVRNNSYAQVLGSMLRMSGIAVSITDEMKLSNSQYFKDMECLLELCGDEFNDNCYNSNAVKILWKLIPYLKITTIGVIQNIMSNLGLSIKDTLAVILRDFLGAGAKDFTRNVEIPGIIRKNLELKCRRMSLDTVQGINTVYEVLKFTDRDLKLARLMKLYMQGVDFLMKSTDIRRCFDAFMQHVGEIVRTSGILGIQQFISSTKQLESGVIEDLRDKVTLTTVHSSKGMEWGHVIIMAYDNIGFPSFKYVCRLKDRKVAIADIGNYLDGERRLNYVALTRAINRLTLVGDFDNFSIFGLEALGVMGKKFPDEIVAMAEKSVDLDKLDYVLDKDTLNNIVSQYHNVQVIDI